MMISMDIEYIKENYIFEKLNENHNLDDFECESKDLTKFLRECHIKSCGLPIKNKPKLPSFLTFYLVEKTVAIVNN